MSDDDETYRRVSLSTPGGGEGGQDLTRHRRHRSSDAQTNHRFMASSPSFSDTLSLGSSSSSTTSWDDKQDRNQFARFADTMRTRVEAKKLELNATLQEKLPEWRSRGQQYGNLARETGLEWSRKGKEAVDRWKKERENGAPPPLPTRPKPAGVFGMPLDHAVEWTCKDDTMLPAVFSRCIDYLEEYGLDEVGIYRVSGSMTAVNKLRALFNSGADVDLHTVEADTHVVSTLLKTYLRELPHPLIPADIDTTQPDLTASGLLSQLPLHNQCLLRALCQHLKHVADRADTNKMSLSNLAVVFIPTLGISRSLFHTLVEEAQLPSDESRSSQSSTRPSPPAVPAKPAHMRPTHQGKTRSDTDLLATIKIPPAKPTRLHHRHTPSASSASSTDDPRLTPVSSATLPLTSPSTKPRSKSLSARPAMGSKVTALGRQFEQNLLITKRS
ncbi:Rho GTPase activation protein [Syncephalastrum racemosum]|uniref:Rho GTPase activation protein n=1 Tax=Syncephalastrum racemosum TaxID=13706 RepID=A0A1X2H7G8_SYNRA|nr:Rho GTPase activation protein [Syncephalastrum racemosum]